MSLFLKTILHFVLLIGGGIIVPTFSGGVREGASEGGSAVQGDSELLATAPAIPIAITHLVQFVD